MVTEVAYPTGAHGDAEVVLELVVEADGSVSAARVVRGDEPFGSATREASLRWRFKPARRGDDATRARIRFAVSFEERRAPEVTPTDAQPALPLSDARKPP